ncbi:cyclin-dependent kinase 2-interacting protein isoform X1 [Paramormyrops kingsleyae]|uniref:cyclin-dependent kinase 2-interacting protein isoform X1 n=1 Tax=Paramormyrops kingsleyae TaxID=1676925 RepID=UPI000CD60B92|nr:cyclin-dependent kinase 2-interacting protein isoform X1 [Paramormyrops kingsleyae]
MGRAKQPGVVSSARKPCLTGSVRKLKNIAADLHNFIFKWERLNDEGFSIASQIVNLEISKRSEKKSHIKLDCENRVNIEHSENEAELDSDMEDGCTALLAILGKMTHLVSKMEKMSCCTKGICALHTYQEGPSGTQSLLFQTWPVTHFDDISSKLFDAYKQELALKQIVVNEIAHISDPNLSLVFLSSWLYQPYIEDINKVLLESLLLETGHRMLT